MRESHVALWEPTRDAARFVWVEPVFQIGQIFRKGSDEKIASCMDFVLFAALLFFLFFESLFEGANYQLVRGSAMVAKWTPFSVKKQTKGFLRCIKPPRAQSRRDQF